MGCQTSAALAPIGRLDPGGAHDWSAYWSTESFDPPPLHHVLNQLKAVLRGSYDTTSSPVELIKAGLLEDVSQYMLDDTHSHDTRISAVSSARDYL